MKIKTIMSDIPTLESIVYWANVAVIAALALSFLAGGTSIIASRWLSAAKDEQARREQNATKEKISELTAETEQAKAERAEADRQIAVAKADAAEANEGAQRLEKENIQLRTDLENATAEARSKDLELTREQQKLTKEQRITAEAQKEAAHALIQAQFNIQQVRSLLMPRRLVKGQNREKFMEALKDRPVATIEIFWAADAFIGEPKKFAEEIAEALKEAGWTISKIYGGAIMRDSNPLNVTVSAGLKITVRNSDNMSPSSLALQWAFLQSGFAVYCFSDDTLEEDAIKLSVLMIPPDGGRVLRLSPK